MSKFFVFAVAVLATVCFCNADEPFVIKSMKDFLEFNKLVINETAVSVLLQTDLDFSSTSFPLPIGVDDDGVCHFFHSDFDGGNHVIKNLKIDATKNKFYGSAALFCGTHGLFGISNLTIDKSCEFTGEVAAAVVVSSTYYSFINVNVYAKVNGVSVASAFVGKIDGYLPGYLPMGSFENCKGEGQITVLQHKGNGYIGGFIGLVNGTNNGLYSLKIVFQENEGSFTFTSKGGDTFIGGMIGAIEKCEGIQFEMYSNTIRTDASTEKKYEISVGGLFGRMLDVPTYKMTMKDNILIESQNAN